MKTTFSQIVKTTARTTWALLGLFFFILLIIFLSEDAQKERKKLKNEETYLSDKVMIKENSRRTDLIYAPTGKKLVKDITYNEYQKNDSLFLFKSHGLYGYVNRYTGALTKPQYEFAGSFRYGLATVVKGNRLYFINRQGKTVIPYSYAVPEDPGDCQFHHRHCVVTLDGSHFGVIDLQGNWVVQPNYDEIKLCADYCIARNNGQFSKQFDYNGQIIHSHLVNDITAISNRNLLLYRANGSYGLVTKDLHLVTQPVYSEIEPFGNNRYKARLLDHESYIILDQNGKEIPLK